MKKQNIAAFIAVGIFAVGVFSTRSLFADAQGGNTASSAPMPPGGYPVKTQTPLTDAQLAALTDDNTAVQTIASATTVDLDSATSTLIDISGTTTITGITLSAGEKRFVRFSGALTLTHGSSLLLPGAANITTVAGDTALFIGYASGVVRCHHYTPYTVTGTGSGVRATSPTLVTPVIGAATGTSLAVSAGLTSTSTTSAGIGYATGAGGTVTQATSRATGVTLSKLSGQITTDTTSLAAAAEAEFTVTNTLVASTDTIIVNITPGGTGTPLAYVSNVGSGSFKITITNLHASTADTSADVINFVVIKAVAN